MKRQIKLAFLLIIATFIGISCTKDDVLTMPTTDAVEDGFYISGPATPYENLSSQGLFATALNEANSNAPADSLKTMFVALRANQEFNITHVAGKNIVKYGPGSDVKTYNPKGEFDQINADVIHGTMATNSAFKVATDGLYQITFYTKTKTFSIANVTHWGIIGGATPGGWSRNTEIPLYGNFSTDKLTFKVENVLILEGDFKLRYSDGWKLNISDITSANSTFKVNANYGGTSSYDEKKKEVSLSLLPGGANIASTKAMVGYYTIELTWTKGNPAMVAKMVKTKDYIAPNYPTNKMYLVGGGVNSDWNWDTVGDELELQGLAGGASNEGIYWRIAYLKAGEGFKISESGWGSWNLGLAASGTVSKGDYDLTKGGGSADMKIDVSGYYMIVLNTRDNKIQLSISDVKVFGIGDAFGGWGEGNAANLFVVDNAAKTISATTTAAGNLRMYAAHKWIPSWWNAEFNVYGGKIEYRGTGGDQPSVSVTAGNLVTLNFAEGTGSVK